MFSFLFPFYLPFNLFASILFIIAFCSLICFNVVFLFIMLDFNCMFKKIYNHINISQLSQLSANEMSEQWALSTSSDIQQNIFVVFISLWLRLLIKIMAHHHPDTVVSLNCQWRHTTNNHWQPVVETHHRHLHCRIELQYSFRGCERQKQNRKP